MHILYIERVRNKPYCICLLRQTLCNCHSFFWFFLFVALFLDGLANLLFKEVPSVVFVHLCDQDQESFIRHTSKLLGIRPEILCV